jgi:hypothetical protein
MGNPTKQLWNEKGFDNEKLLRISEVSVATGR